jgi:hypothetical protein
MGVQYHLLSRFPYLRLLRQYANTTARKILNEPRIQCGSEAFLSNGMDQQETDDKYHGAGYAMN